MGDDTREPKATGGGAARPRFALYWGAACGGCEVAVLNTHEALLELDRDFELFFCPCLVDTKRADVEALPDGGLYFTLFNGALRTEHDLEMARLLRRKSRHLVAFGSCATEGCVPGLANLLTREETLARVYVDTPTAEPGARPPCPRSEVPGGSLALPALLPRVGTLADGAVVDYSVPGCPPEARSVLAVFAAFASARRGESALPLRGAVLGAGRRAVCDECPRARDEKQLARLCRTFEVAPEPGRCLLDQGIVCMGPATRDGCGAPCLAVDAPCVGCYGPPEGVHDQGAKMASALASMLSLAPLRDAAEGPALDAAAGARLDAIPDLVGTLYKHGLASSLLGRRPAGRRDPGTGGAA